MEAPHGAYAPIILLGGGAIIPIIARLLTFCVSQVFQNETCFATWVNSSSKCSKTHVQLVLCSDPRLALGSLQRAQYPLVG